MISSKKKFEVGEFEVGDHVVIPPQNLNKGRQYLAHATGEITHITGAKASVMLDEPANQAYKPHTVKINLCSLRRISSRESERFRLQQQQLEELGQLNLLNLIQMPNSCCDRVSQESPSTAISGTFPPQLENTNSLLSDFPVPEPALQVMVADSTTQSQACGLKHCDVLQSDYQPSSLLKILRGLSLLDYEQCLEDSEWSDIVGMIHKSYRLRNLEHHTKGSACSSLPTPTTYAKGSGKYRPAGATRLEQSLRKFISQGDKLHPAAPGWMMGFPPGWVEEILMAGGQAISTKLPFIPECAPTQPNVESVTTSTPGQSAHCKQPLSYVESFTSTPSSLKAISLWQPWASLIPLGLKHYETRSWKTSYRGKLLICSAVKLTKEQYQQYLKICNEVKLPAWDETNFPRGRAIAVCDLVDCIEMTPCFIEQQSKTEILCGDWLVGRYAWKLENIQPIREPFAVKGKQGLFNISLPGGCICSVSTQVLEDDTTSRDLIEAQTTSRIQVTSSPSGSLYRYLKNVKLKSGEIASYPRIQGGRDPDNLNHWYWGYNYKILESGEWRTKSLSVSRVRVAQVHHMIENNAPITAIKAFIKVLEDDNANSREREFDEIENNYRKVLEDDNADSREKPQASGSLYRYLKNKKLKSGVVASYPAFEGVRDPDNPSHWYWGYSYEVLEDGEWKGRSLSVPRHKVVMVQAMIGSHRSVNEIKGLIEGEKVNCVDVWRQDPKGLKPQNEKYSYQSD